MAVYRSSPLRGGALVASPESSSCTGALADEFSKIKILETSKKGRLSYDNGWDRNPGNFLKVVSTVQQSEEHLKIKVLEKTYQITQNQPLSRRSRRSKILGSCETAVEDFDDDNSSCSSSTANEFFNNDYYESSSATETNTPVCSSPIGEKMRLPEFRDGPDGLNRNSRNIRRSVSFHDKNNIAAGSNYNIGSSDARLVQDLENKSILATSKLPLAGKIGIRGLGIREDEYEDNDAAPEFIKDTALFLKIKKAFDIELKYAREAEERIRVRRKSYVEDLKEKRQDKLLEPKRKSFMSPQQEERLRIVELENKKNTAMQQIEREKRKELNKAQVAERMKIIQDLKRKEEETVAAIKAAEAKSAAETAAKEEAERNKREEQMKEEEAAKSKAAAEAAKLEEAAKVQPAKVLSTLQSTTKGLEVPQEFQGCVLSPDLQRYVKSQQFLSECKEKFAHITAKTAATKDYYSQALRVVNTTLNSIASSMEHNRSKVNQLTALLSGNPVSIGESQGPQFLAGSQPNGDVFVATLLAHRFVKKSENEITKGCASVEPLAMLGVAVAANCPHWALMVRGYFYKMCPFLVPFSFPRGEKSIEEYAAAMDHSIKGTESAINQALIDRWCGYCTLYGLMVKSVERQRVTSLGEAAEFFTLREVWRILSTMMTLTPQVDLTATTIQALLESVGDRLYACYGAQFKKLVMYLSSTFLSKIREVTPAKKVAAVTRLELFLEKKIQSGFL